jgi:hypothetical protein
MKKQIFSLMIILSLVLLSAGFASAVKPVSPSMWLTKTDCSTAGTKAEQFNPGETVYAHGTGFTPNTYVLSIRENPFKPSDIITPDQNKVVNATGNFCFAAYTIQLDDDGEYRVYVGDVNENFHDDENAPVVPEFGTAVGVLTALGALGVFFLVRKK